jgi:hypothetical protein
MNPSRSLSKFTRFLGNIENGTVIVFGKVPHRATHVDVNNDSFVLSPISWDEV